MKYSGENMSKAQSQKLSAFEILFGMGGFGVLLFGIFYLSAHFTPWSMPILIVAEGALFATPHFLSTFVRVLSDPAETERHRFNLFLLPILLFAGLMSWSTLFGTEMIWIFGSLYFYWQWWHHARQSFGLGRYYQSQDQILAPQDRLLNDLALWTVALLGIALRSTAAGEQYEGIPIQTIHLPVSSLSYIFSACVIVVLFFLIKRLPSLIFNPSSRPFFIHWLIQSFVFVVFFGLLPAGLGIIAASLWHCTQYLTYSWRHQQKKHQSVGFANLPLSKIFQPKAIIFYLGGLIILALIKFQFDRQVIFPAQIAGLAFAYSLAINFQHYILDGILWTRKEIDWSLGKGRQIEPTGAIMPVIR
ncbi:MAG: hypothetical protein SFT81_02885 [Candidatus Caenarcaniphilales bacterium]|nr:hypothetical protein [Candidatus Caenarcaniphilales bacterium]